MPATQVQRQVNKAARRLFIQTLLDTMAWCWAAAVLLAVGWFIAQPWLLGEADNEWLRWYVAGGIFLVGTVLAVWLAARHTPSRIEAALEVDLRFHLKERATTALTLVPELAQTEAGQALAADAELHVSKVDVRSGFPVRLKWPALLVPLSAAVLALVAVFYHPDLSSADPDRQRNAQKVANAKEIAEKMDNLKKKSTLQWPKENKNEKLEELEKLREKLLSQKFDPNDKDMLREQLQKFVPWEDKLKDRIDERMSQAERDNAMKNALKDMGNDADRKLAKDGPAKDLQDALNKGDMNKAQQELQKLADQLNDNKLSDEERKSLQDQLDEIQQRLNELADMHALKEALKSDLDLGKLSQEEFDRLMAKAFENADLLKDLKEFSGKLGKAKLITGDLKDAGEILAALAKDLKDLDLDGKELLLLLEQQQLSAEAKLCIQQGLGNQPGQQPGGMGSGLLPGGKRQVAKDGDTAAKDARQKGDPSQFQITGVHKGGIFTKIPPAQVGGAFQKAQQDAPQAIDRQQVPPDAADVLRGYYQNLGGAKKR